MRARLFVLSVAIAMLFSSLAFGQTCNNHNATGTITDSDGQTWNGATYTVAFYNPSGTQIPVCRTTGQAITTNYSGTLNASGQFTQSLPDTSAIDPAGQWIFTIQPNASGTPTVMRPITLTANTSFSTVFSSQLSPLRFACIGTCYGYNTSEVSPAINGNIFTNVATGATVTCNVRVNGVWQGCSINSGVNLILSTNNHTGVSTLSGANLNVPDYSLLFNTLWGNSGVPSYDSATGTLNIPGHLNQSDPPSGSCNASNIGQEVWTSPTLPKIGVTKYVCTQIAGPSWVWVGENATEWGFVTPSNSPTGTGQLCVSTGTTSCQYQTVPIVHPETLTITPLAGAGTGGTFACNTGTSLVCAPNYGSLVGTIGTTPAAGDFVRISWPTAWDHRAMCVVNGYDQTTSTIISTFIQDVGASSTTQAVFFNSVAPTAAHSILFQYTCL